MFKTRSFHRQHQPQPSLHLIVSCVTASQRIGVAVRTPFSTPQPRPQPGGQENLKPRGSSTTGPHSGGQHLALVGIKPADRARSAQNNRTTQRIAPLLAMAKSFSDSLKILKTASSAISKGQTKGVFTNQPQKQVIKAALQEPIQHNEPTIMMRTAVPGNFMSDISLRNYRFFCRPEVAGAED